MGKTPKNITRTEASSMKTPSSCNRCLPTLARNCQVNGITTTRKKKLTKSLTRLLRPRAKLKTTQRTFLWPHQHRVAVLRKRKRKSHLPAVVVARGSARRNTVLTRMRTTIFNFFFLYILSVIDRQYKNNHGF